MIDLARAKPEASRGLVARRRHGGAAGRQPIVRSRHHRLRSAQHVRSDRARSPTFIASCGRAGGSARSTSIGPNARRCARVYLAFLTVFGSTLGCVLHGDPDTYRYIPASIRRYPGARGVCDLMRAAGFADVRHIRVLGGFMAIHVAVENRPRRSFYETRKMTSEVIPMDVSDLRKRILRALDDARKDATSRRAVVDEATQAYATFLQTLGVPLLKQAVQVLRAEEPHVHAEHARRRRSARLDELSEYISRVRVRRPAPVPQVDRARQPRARPSGPRRRGAADWCRQADRGDH